MIQVDSKDTGKHCVILFSHQLLQIFIINFPMTKHLHKRLQHKLSLDRLSSSQNNVFSKDNNQILQVKTEEHNFVHT